MHSTCALFALKSLIVVLCVEPVGPPSELPCDCEPNVILPIDSQQSPFQALRDHHHIPEDPSMHWFAVVQDGCVMRRHVSPRKSTREREVHLDLTY